MSDLFVSLFKLTDAKEDLFTECFAATLRENVELAKQFLARICGNEVNGVKIRTASVEIKTQRQCGDSCVDMVFALVAETSAVTIGVENKLDSPASPGQLLKYLRLKELDRLAFITAYYAALEHEVREHPHYLRPKDLGRDHFMWADFYELMLTANTVYTLSVKVGHRLDYPLAPFSVQLLAGGVVLNQATLDTIPAGEFQTVTVTFTAPADHPQLGQPLEIRLTANNANLQQVNFDDVKLDATAQ